MESKHAVNSSRDRNLSTWGEEFVQRWHMRGSICWCQGPRGGCAELEGPFMPEVACFNVCLGVHLDRTSLTHPVSTFVNAVITPERQHRMDTRSTTRQAKKGNFTYTATRPSPWRAWSSWQRCRSDQGMRVCPWCSCGPFFGNIQPLRALHRVYWAKMRLLSLPLMGL